jgi:formate hydrogenlyase subunit 5
MMKNSVEKNITPDQLIATCHAVHEQGDRMQMAYAWYPKNQALPEIIYLASMGSKQPFHSYRCQLTDKNQLDSLATLSPLLGWYEREITDLFGTQFLMHPEAFPLILHEGVQDDIHPYSPNYPEDTLLDFKSLPWQLPKFENENVQRLPYGPIRAAVCESAQFIYFYAGETILHFYERLFFKHRGMEQRFKNLTPELGVILAERVSGVSSVAHALAFCQAIEAATNCEISLRAKQWRIILAELERLYNHLHYLGHLCHTTTLKVGEAEGKLLEEKIKQLNTKITGSRFLREILTPGGLRREPHLQPIKAEFKALQKEILFYCDALKNTNSHIDRLIGNGVLTREVAFDEGATGPILRASDIKYDFRVDHPYSAYDQYSIDIPSLATGDAHARMLIRMQEIASSIQLITQIADNLADGAIKTDYHIQPYQEGLGWAESPRGGLFYAVHFDERGLLQRVKIKSPSFSNWRVFPFTVHNTNMMDYAINEASFGLTVAGCDR